MGALKPRKRIREKQRRRTGDSPVPGCEAEVPSPPASDTVAESPAPKFPSSSMGVGSMLGALAGDAPRGGVVDGGSPLRLLLLPLPSCKPDKVNIIALNAYHVSNKRRATNLRWGLCRGLLSRLLNTTSGVFEAPAGS